MITVNDRGGIREQFFDSNIGVYDKEDNMSERGERKGEEKRRDPETENMAHKIEKNESTCPLEFFGIWGKFRGKPHMRPGNMCVHNYCSTGTAGLSCKGKITDNADRR